MDLDDGTLFSSVDVDVADDGTRRVDDAHFLFGKNLIDLQNRSIWKLFADELMHPFNVFQLASVAIWCAEEYYVYALTIFLISVVSTVVTLKETHENDSKLRQLSRFQCQVRLVVDRDGVETGKGGNDDDEAAEATTATVSVVDSSELVPGDRIVLDGDLTACPADMVLLQGDAIVDESMLTGESVPVCKTPGSLLFAGTRLLRARHAQARIHRTGFSTMKGQLLQSILFPKPIAFSFYSDSLKYVYMLAGLAVVGFIFSLYSQIRAGMSTYYIVTRALDLITVVLPPALPATLSIGTMFALQRLKTRHQIHCISPSKINVASKIDVVCFDKTGTLTEDGLSLHCVLDADGRELVQAKLMGLGMGMGMYESISAAGPSKATAVDAIEQQSKERPTISEADDKENQPPSGLATATASFLSPQATTATANLLSIQQCMALCHSLQSIDNVLVGDPLDRIMFEATGWLLEDPQNSLLSAIVRDPAARTNSSQALRKHQHHQDGPPPPSSSSSFGILKCFDFCSELRRMSVIVRGMERGSELMAYCKGSPESILECCKPASIPDSFREVLDQYARAGFRVIACAGRILPQVAWLKQQSHLSREEVEVDMHFLGFLVFENRLKPASPPVIAELATAGIASLMVTGDNLFTAVCVARSCGIISGDDEVWTFVGDASAENPVTTTATNPDSASTATTTALMKLQCIQSGHVIGLEHLILQPESVVIACTGAELQRLLNLTDRSGEFEIIKAVLRRTRVFARMSPEGKKMLVELIQDRLKQTVAFCGDGANDCGALKAADIGISLSDSEASVAAPFSCACRDVSCVLTVLKEGRAALSTSFAAFKFMALYSMVQFTSLLLLYSGGSSLGDNQFMLIDLLLILPLGALMSRFEPAERLSLAAPETKLISPSVLSSLLCQICLQVLAQAYIYFSSRPPSPSLAVAPTSTKKPVVKGTANSAVFLFSLLVYLAAAGLFSSWRPFRKFYAPFYGYAALMLALTFALIWTAGQVPWITDWLELVRLEDALQRRIAWTALAHWMVSFSIEHLIFYLNCG